MNVSCNSSVSGNVHVDVLFQYAMIIVVLLLYIDETKIKIINYIKRNSRTPYIVALWQKNTIRIKIRPQHVKLRS